MARNRIIGRDNALPWRLSEDLKRFKSITMGKPILMGRKTFESIGKPLPGRRNIVLTRDRGWHADGADAVGCVQEAIDIASGATELAVIGGAEIYRLALPQAALIHLTRVEAEVVGDTVFPELERGEWEETPAGAHPADERNQYPMTFLTLSRSHQAAR